jgi:hypothetical protein
MHPVANQVEIPTDKLSEAMEKCAVPGFTGDFTGHLRVLPTAGFEVEFLFEKRINIQVNKSDDPERPHVTNARVAKVRRVLLENAHRFRLGTKLARVFGTFVDGELRRFEVIEAESQ